MPPKKSTKRKAAKRSSKRAGDGVIQVRGARQNNLRGIDVDVPLGELTVVTGPSGSGKSSFAFQTLYAEGQRRYIETFSPYTRQFFDRMDKPDVDEVDGIPPAIAIEQANHVKSTRSTVGTITELNDYLKVLFPRIAKGYCPETGQEIRPHTPEMVLAEAGELGPKDTPYLLSFPLDVPEERREDVAGFFEFLGGQGYLRVLVFGAIYRTDAPGDYDREVLPAQVDVVQDRVKPSQKARFLEATESAMSYGEGVVHLSDPEGKRVAAYSKRWLCVESGIELRPPTPALFTFNNPLGACPTCRGFGRVIGIDLEKAVPDPSLTIRDGAVKAFQGERGSECQADLERCCRSMGVDIDCAFEDLPESERDWVLYGEAGDPEDVWEMGDWYGVKGFFDWMEKKAYKMHVRVFLSRYRSYTKCGDCRGTRLQPQALCYRVEDKTLPQIWQMPITELTEFFAEIEIPEGDRTGAIVLGEVRSRLHYLGLVGLGYLDLDRPTRTLSGGEVERVNLTTCLGASLTGTLFVLDEPSVGLHARDVDRLIRVMGDLRDKGNTLVVVEHEEAVMRAADHLIEIGPGRGEGGGQLVHSGPADSIGDAPFSLTGAYLSGRDSVPVPEVRRQPTGHLRVIGARHHNLQNIDVDFPLGVLCCVSGVSGCGKSTLVHHVLYRNLAKAKGVPIEEEPGRLRALEGAEKIRDVVMVDQSPLARTPRSTPAVFLGSFEPIRKLFAATEDAKHQGLKMGDFSFNGGTGRCERCWGNGFEKIEMQFLSDVFVSCPECDGRRYQPFILEIELEGNSVRDILDMTAAEALEFFTEIDEEGTAGTKGQRWKILNALRLQCEVGLGYLRLGQALNTLSGGESQRLKLCAHLLEKRAGTGGDLLIFDEPTTGLHMDDVKMLLGVFHRLVEAGDTVLVIEHHLDVIASADHVIDLGPEGGTGGGEVVAEGTPEEIAKAKGSITAKFLKPHLGEMSGIRYQMSDSKAAKVAESSPSNFQLPTSNSAIAIRGAREHNLKNLDLDIPKSSFVVVTGLSGSGKSTLAFDIVFAEGQRRFLDSMSTYARQFVEQMERPEVDQITGLPPTVAIEQRISRGGGKSTVATVTEVYHFLRLLWSKLGVQHSPATGKPTVQQTASEITTRVRAAAKSGRVSVLAPLIKARKGYHTEVAAWAGKQGFTRLLVDGAWIETEDFRRLDRFREHSIDAEVAVLGKGSTVAEAQDAIERALKIGKGMAKFVDAKNKVHVLSTDMVCADTGRAFEELDPRMFSFNSPHGWCRTCRGFGRTYKRHKAWRDDDGESLLAAELNDDRKRGKADPSDMKICPDCEGARLHDVARFVFVQGQRLEDITALPVAEAQEAVAGFSFKGREAKIARDILVEIAQRLRFLQEVGLGYLSLDRSATTLSGGESQRIRLASQLGSNLRGVLYVLDEPTIGLHPRDNANLIRTLTALRDSGNSLLVVEHDEDTMAAADRLIDLGPGAGKFGGEVTGQGTFKQVARMKGSVTGQWLKAPMVHPLHGERRKLPAPGARKGWLRLKGCKANNLRSIDVQIPLARLTVITGVSGSGKSSFMRGCLKPAADLALKKLKTRSSKPKTWTKATGFDQLTAVYEVDQSPIGKTSRSTPGTYTKVFDEIRKLFSGTPLARMRGYGPGRFSFNTEGGRCETCGGHGVIKLEMAFLPTSYVQCDSCRGARYNTGTLEVEYHGKTIGDVMNMSVSEAAEFFDSNPKIARALRLLHDTGTGYLGLGQPSPTLSGGEAQRVKLVAELSKGVARSENAKLKGREQPGNLYLIEEPTIGLHMSDVAKLIDVLHRLVDAGNTVVVIEHNLDVAAEADYLLDIGPEAGDAGGTVVAAGTPEEVVKVKASATAPVLAKLLG